jgi:hypothetical protein
MSTADPRKNGLNKLARSFSGPALAFGFLFTVVWIGTLAWIVSRLLQI